MHLDHVTLRTRDLDTTREFLIRLLDLEDRPRPVEIQRRIAGHWLYAGDQPFIHLIPSFDIGQAPTTEAIDHVGIRLDDYAGFKGRLEAMDVPYSLMDIEEIHERRIFFRTPGGNLLEAVFNEQTIDEQQQ